MLQEAIASIKALAERAAGITDQLEVEGVPHVVIGGRLLPLTLSGPGALGTRTLQSVVDYIKQNRDRLEVSDLTVHIVSPGRVEVIDRLRVDHSRHTYLVATEPDASSEFGKFVNRYMNIESFIIGMQRHFRTGFGDLANILAVVGNITQGDVRQVEDDGVTQSVTMRAGITKVGITALPSPVMLVPKRSFPEVELSAVPFVVRVRATDKLPEVSLHECDGDSWKVDAADKIVEFFADAFGEKDGEAGPREAPAVIA